MLYGLPDIYIFQKIIHNDVWWVFDTVTFPHSSLLTFPHHGGILPWWEYAGKPWWWSLQLRLISYRLARYGVLEEWQVALMLLLPSSLTGVFSINVIKITKLSQCHQCHQNHNTKYKVHILREGRKVAGEVQLRWEESLKWLKELWLLVPLASGSGCVHNRTVGEAG